MEREQRRISAFEIAAVYAIFCVVGLVSYGLQKPLSINQGMGWDGAAYSEVASQIAAGQLPTGAGPFVYRVGTPALAALAQSVFRQGLVETFKLVNVAGSACIPLLLLLLLAPYVESRAVRIGLAAIFLLYWQAPLRFSMFYPVTSDPWSIVFIMAGLLVMQRWSGSRGFGMVVLLSALCVLGTLFRETMLLVPLAFLFVDNPLTFDRDELLFVKVRLPPAQVFVPLVAAVATFVALRYFVHAPPPAAGERSYSFAEAILANFFRKSFVTFLHGLFIFFGPVLTLVFFRWRQGQTFLRQHQAQAAFLSLALAAAWVGGWDTERYAVMAVPVVFVLLGLAIESLWQTLASPALLAMLALSQAVAERVFWSIPDAPTDFPHRLPLLTPWGSQVPFMDLYAYFRIYSEASGELDMGRIKVAVAGWLEYLALVVVLLFWLRWRTRAVAAESQFVGLAADETR